MRIKVCGIYCIQNKLNKKLLIGSSNDIRRRRNGHYNLLNKDKHYNIYLQRAFNKNGCDNFNFILLFECDEMDLIKWEQFFIDSFQSSDKRFGYNIAPRADRTKLAEVTKIKIGLANKGKIVSEETRKRQSIAQKNRDWKLSEDAKRIIGAAQIGRKKTPEEIRKTVLKNTGRKMSPESIEKGRLARIGFKHSEENKKRMSERMKGKFVGEKNYFYGKNFTGSLNPFFGCHHTKETKEKISKANKGRCSVEHLKILKLNSEKAKKPVLQFDKNNNFLQEFSSLKEAAQVTGLSMTTIWLSIKQKVKPRNYIFKYKNP